MKALHIRKKFLAALKYYKIILQIILGLLFVLFGAYFIKNEQLEMSKVKNSLLSAEPFWIVWGLILLAAFIIVQGMMYQQSFRAIHERIKLSTGIGLFLKRNLISVFLPAGVLTNMLFFNKSIERKEGITKTNIYFASSIFSFCSILSAVIIGIPSLFWLLMKGSLSRDMVWGILLTSVLLALIVYVVVSLVKKGSVYHFLENKFPAFSQTLNTLSGKSLDQKKIGLVLVLSLLIEIIGIAHLYISIRALGGYTHFGNGSHRVYYRLTIADEFSIFKRHWRCRNCADLLFGVIWIIHRSGSIRSLSFSIFRILGCIDIGLASITEQ
ncbi:MAG TPA: lysylphosphatidylglycerol synthase domain-containing protein [Saprospiraceae bacterium]|nr:lysylphosphatidylglycerol synthase domain-containing protein [Saprospiraceae bacterium]